MDSEKKVLGKAFNWTCFAVEENLKLFSVASQDGSISIFSPDDTLIFEDTIGKINHLQFLSKKGNLIGFGNELGLHLWQPSNEENSFIYKFHHLEIDSGIFITSINQCKQITFENFSNEDIHILIGYNNGTMEICTINESQVIRSNTIQLEEVGLSNKKIDQIIKTNYAKGILTIMILINKNLVEIECIIDFRKNSNTKIDSINLEFRKINHKFEFDFSHAELLDNNQIIISTYDGRYGVIESTVNCLEEKEMFNKDLLIFPYGPFPCKSIDKCLVAKFPGIKAKCHVFSGGMPAVTYKHLNAVSISIEDEPEICFTFDDAVIDFTVILNESNDGNEILVLTTTECVVISYNNGKWNTHNKSQIYSFSKSQITRISNIIQVENYVISDDSGISSNDRIENYKNLPVKLFATSYDNSNVSIWFLTPDQCILRENINLNDFYKTSTIEQQKKSALWPKFQKCGHWKSIVTDNITVESIKLISHSKGLIYLLISTNRKSIFLFKVNPNEYENIDNKSQYNQWCHHHISVINDQANNYQINTAANNNSDYLYLINLITFSDQFDSYILDFNVHGNILIFLSRIEFCCVDIVNGKYLIFNSSVFKLDENSKTEKLQRKFRKRKSLEYSLAKLEIDEIRDRPNRPSSITAKSIFLWQYNQNKFEIFLGFTNGTIITINFLRNENSDFCTNKVYRKLFTKTCQEIINLYVFEMPFDTSFTTNTKLVDNSFEAINQTDNHSICTNTSPDLNSLCTTDGTFNDNISMRSSKFKTLSFNWLKSRETELKNKIFLLRIDQCSIKVIEYYKMKTRFKFKIFEYFMKDSAAKMSKKKTKTLDNSTPIIIESRIRESDVISTTLFCILFLSNNSMLELSLPHLCVLRKYNFNMENLNVYHISIDSDFILIAENFNGTSQMNVLGNRKYRNCKLILGINEDQQEHCKDKDKKQVDQMDFMKEAKMSLDSLLC